MVQSTPEDSSHETRGNAADPPPTIMGADLCQGASEPPRPRVEDTIVDGSTAMSPEAPATPEEIPAGTLLGKYEIRRRLGYGGMGEVYLAWDPMLEREVALKVLLPHVADRPALLERFIREARAIGKLNHPHVVAIHDIGEAGRRHYIVMELLNGGSVHNLIRETGAVPWREACRLIADAADGLDAAHSAGLIHRDIKPENLMLASDRSVKIVDFGLAKSLASQANDAESTVSRAGQVMGTPQFMSPEQFMAGDVDHRCDIYGLGGAFYQLLTARFPFGDAETVVQLMYAHLEQPPPDPCRVRSDVPRQCAQIIARAMAKQPEDRYQSGRELAFDLRAVVDSADEDFPVLPDTSLQSVCIVEPSRMQGQVLKQHFARHGAASVQLCSDAEACAAADLSETDLLVTSMQLPGMSGAELIRKVVGGRLQTGSTVILRSDDVSLTEIATPRSRQPAGIVPRSSRPVDLLRAIAAMSNVRATGSDDEPEVDKLTVRGLICCDGPEVPAELAELIRESGLLDIQVRTNQSVSGIAADSDSFDLRVMVCGDSGRRIDSAAGFHAVLDLCQRPPAAGIAIVAEVRNGQLLLRGIASPGLRAVTCCLLTSARLDAALRIRSDQ